MRIEAISTIRLSSLPLAEIHIGTLPNMSLLRQSTQALRAVASASSSARWMSTSSVIRNTAHPNSSPAPATRTDNQGRDLTAEQLQRHEQAVSAELVSGAPGTFPLDAHSQHRVGIETLHVGPSPHKHRSNRSSVLYAATSLTSSPSFLLLSIARRGAPPAQCPDLPPCQDRQFVGQGGYQSVACRL